MNKADKKSIYCTFCETHPEMPLFFQPWWLDAVCRPGDWEVAVEFDADGAVTGLMPYYLTRKWGFPVIRMPMLTPFLGPWFVYPKKISKESRIRTFQWDVVRGLLRQVPENLYFMYHCQYAFTDWLPFYWAGYRQTTKYSYLLDLSDVESLYRQFKGSVRSSIKKATGLVDIITEGDPDDFFNVNLKTFLHQGKPSPYSREFFLHLDGELSRRNRRRIYVARDAENNDHAAAYIVWDDQSAYLLALGTDPVFRSSGAASLLIWKAIRDASGHVGTFDFEGSIIQGVSRFFNAFSGDLQPYHRIYRGRNLFIDALRILTEKRL